MIFPFQDILARLKFQKIKVILVLHNEELKKQLEIHGIIAEIGDKHIFNSEPDAIDFAKKCLRKKFRRNFKKALD